MKKYFLIVILIMTSFFVYTATAYAQTVVPQSALKVDYKAQIQEIKDNELNYDLNNFNNFNSTDRIKYSKQFSLNTSDVNNFKKGMQDSLDKAYVYYIDENGNVFDNNGYIETLDISGNQSSEIPVNQSLDTTDAQITNNNVAGEQSLNNYSITPLTQTASSINGGNTGAFIRQTSVAGYMGIYSQMLLPTNANTTSDYISMTNGIGFLYNKLYYSTPGQTAFWDMEAGLQYSTQFDNYGTYIRVNGSAQTSYDINNTIPPRFKSNTTITQNLRYESSKIRYYANGTNINNTYQAVIYGVAKTFADTTKIRVGRVTGIGYSGYTGTQSLGKVNLTYSSVKFLKSSNSTQVTPTTSLLDTWVINNITYGTVDWPSAKVSKTPSSGSIGSQTQTLTAQ